jgi:hypothetical protein
MKTCKNGHAAEQRNKYGHCKRCAADSQKRARENNPEKFRARDKLRFTGERRKKNLENARRRHAANRTENLQKMKAYNAKNRETISRRQKQYNQLPKTKSLRRRLAGLPDPTRMEPSLCECCGAPPGRKGMALDHCHKTGIFRGWLCFNCNSAIGKLGDNLPGVLRAVAYLLKPGG